jgi:copper chaperone
MKRELIIEGMSCNHCLNAVKEALATVESIKVESVELGRASIEADDAGLAQARTAIEDDGYKVLEAK